MKRSLEFLEKSFTIFGLLYFTATLNFFGGVTSAEDPTLRAANVTDGNSLLAIMQNGVLAVTLLLNCIRYKKIIYLASRRKFLWALTGLIFLSFLWSAVPDLTLKRSVTFLGLILFGLNVSARYSLREQLFILAWTMGILVGINFIFTLALPSVGIETGEHGGAWRGVYVQKNLLARMAVLSSITFLLAALESHSKRHILWIGLGLSVLLVLLSTSKGALVTFIVLLIILPLFSALRASRSMALPLFIIALLCVSFFVIVLIGNTESIVKFLGRDLTLTGRTGIWSVVIGKIAQHPWVGYGYKGFWLGLEGDSADVWYETFFMAPHSHNGFLDVTVELGLIGLSFFLLTFGKSCVRAIAWLRLNPTAEGLFPIMYLLFIVLYNLAENTLTDPNYFVWALYSSITTSVLIQPISDPRSSFDSTHITTIEI